MGRVRSMFLLGILATTAGISCLVQLAVAGPLYLNAGGGTATWDNSTALDWSSNSTGSPLNSVWIANSDAHFVGSGGTVTMSGPISRINSLNFDAGGYTLNLNGANQVVGSLSSGTTTGTAIYLSGGSLTVDATASSTFSGWIYGMNNTDPISPGTFTYAGTGGCLTETGGFYCNTTRVTAGTLQVASATGLMNTVFDANGGGVLSFTSTLSWVGALSGSGNIALNNSDSGGGVSLYLITPVGSASTYSGVLSGSGSLIKAASCTQTLAGASTYTGGTTVRGMLAVTQLANGGSPSSIGASNSTASNLTLDGGELQYVGTAAAFTDRGFTLTSNGGTLDASGGGPLAVSASRQ